MMTFESEKREPSLPEGFWYSPNGNLWYVLSPEKFAAIPEEVNVNGKIFHKKNEFHITMINGRECAGKIAEQTGQSVSEVVQELLILFSKYLSNNEIILHAYEDDLRLAISDTAESIAVRCRVEGLEGYFQILKDTYGIAFPIQPAHVSLYIHTETAVGINSDEQMEAFEKVEIPEIQKNLRI
jgi:hypothetical protein